jgi:hypothetical protein
MAGITGRVFRGHLTNTVAPLGETQEGAGTVSESFLAASRMIPGDYDSWHKEWLVVADANMKRGEAEEAKGHIQTAMNCYLRAADMYRSAEFWLEPDDARRMPTRQMRESHAQFPALDVPAR